MPAEVRTMLARSAVEPSAALDVEHVVGVGLRRRRRARGTRTVAGIAAASLLVVGVFAALGGRGAPVVLAPGEIPGTSNGVIAFIDESGDLVLGDPATGTVERLVAGPWIDGPVFSPDGSRIAFLRGQLADGDPADLLVVAADGTDERLIASDVVVAQFAWMPAGDAVVVHGGGPGASGDWALTVYDAVGSAPPRLLTPPLPVTRGGPAFWFYAQVAPMVRPPDGDRLLHADTHGGGARDGRQNVTVMDDDGGNAEVLVDGADGPEQLEWPAWSPDGSMIAFLGAASGDLLDPTSDDPPETEAPVRTEGFTETEAAADVEPASDEDVGVTSARALVRYAYVLNADGTQLRRLARFAHTGFAWSPDGTRIAVELRQPHSDTVRIGIFDVVTGVGVESELAELSGPWIWSPDGRSILLVRPDDARMVVVDVETGVATPLPFRTTAAAGEPAPSWQRVG